MNKKFWRDWILLWALIPWFHSFFMMAVLKQINYHDPSAALHSFSSLVVAIITLCLIVFVPFLCLKKHAHSYSFNKHSLILCLLAVGWIVIYLLQTYSQAGNIQWTVFDLEKEFLRAFISLELHKPIYFNDLIYMPWWKLFASTAFQSFIFLALPIYIICNFLGRQKYFFFILLLVVLGCFAFKVSNLFFDLIQILDLKLTELNGRRWSKRIEIISTYSVSTAIGASISAIGFNYLVDQTKKNELKNSYIPQGFINGFLLSLLIIILLWSTSYCLYYAIGPKGFRFGFPELHKIFTVDPEQDVSTGKNILEYSHDIQANIYRYSNPYYANINISPDGKYAIILEAHGIHESQLSVFNVENGNRIKRLGKPLSQFEYSSQLWSKNGKYLIVRSHGDSELIGRYIHRHTRLRVYSVPKFELISDWQLVNDKCLYGSSSNYALSEDLNGSLHLLCFPLSTPSPREVMTVGLSIPELEVQYVRKYLVEEQNYNARKLVEVTHGHVFAFLINLKEQENFKLAGLSESAKHIEFEQHRKLELVGGLTFQDVEIDQADNSLYLRYCGSADMVSNPPENLTNSPWGSSFCREIKYSSIDGAYLGFEDSSESRIARPSNEIREYSVDTDELRFVGTIDPTKKAGEIKVVSRGSGKVFQTLRTKAQLPIEISDSRLLFTYQIDNRTIAVYNIADP